MPPSAPVVWINAFPGVGKLTVARALAASDPDSYIVIDNHQLIDPVAAVFARDHPEYQGERKKERAKAFQRYILAPDMASKTIVFTDFQSSDDLGSSVAREYSSVAGLAGRPFVPVILTCSPEVNIKRLESPERANGGTTKLTDTAVLKTFLERSRLFAFDDHDGDDAGVPRLKVDVTSLAPEKTAAKIAAQCARVCLVSST